ncbi:YIP1 family protein [Halosimplex sp. J119]
MPSIQSLLTDPDGFFRSRTSGLSLKWPLAIVALVAALRVAASVITSRGLSELVSQQGLPASGAGSGPIAFATAAALPFLAWVLYAGLFYLLSGLFDGEGAFKTILAFVGYGFAPQVVGSAVTALVQFYRWNVRGVSVTFPSGIADTPPSQMSGEQAFAYTRALQEAQSGPLVTLTAVLGLLFTIWAAFIWMFATKRARDVSTRQAAISVGIPVGIVVVLQLALFAVGTLLF